MNIAVCVKQSIDTEAIITLDDQGQVVTEGAALIIDPYAEFAVERAIQLKEEHGGEVVIVAVGDDESTPAIRHALSMGADRAVLIDDAAIDQTNPQAKARVLAAALKTLNPDLIMGGTKSGDTSRAQTLPRIATILGMPQVSLVVEANLEGESLAVSHETDDGLEKFSVALPAVIAAQQGLAEPRYPNVRDIMKSKKKPIDKMTLADLGLPASEVDSSIRQVAVQSYALKPERKGGRIVEGETADAVKETASLLQSEAKVL